MISKRFIKSFLPLFFQLPHKTLTKFIFYPFSFFKKAEQKTLLNYFDKELTESDFQIKITEIENQVYLNWNDENFDLCLKLRLESQAIKQSYYKSEQYEGFSEDCCKIGVLYTELLEDEKALIYFDLALQHLLDDPINYPIISDIKHNKGISLKNQGHLAEAIFLVEEAKSLKKLIYNPDEDYLSLGITCFNLGNMYSETYGYLENSLENYEESIKYFKSGMQFNPKECSMNLANALEQMGSLLFAMKNFQRSKEIFLNSPNLFEEAFGENHIIFVKSLCNASIVLNSLGDYKQAEINLLKAKKIVDKPTEATWSLYNLVHILLSRLYSSIGNRPKIEQILQLIESTILKFNVVDLTHLHLFYLEKSFFLIEFEEFERCFDTVKKCMDINQKIYCNVRKNNTFPIIFMIYAKYFMLFKNDPIKAIGYLDEALDKSLEIYGETHEITAQILKLKGELLWKQKKIDEAIKLFENAESVFEKFKEICFWELADVRSDLGQIWLEKGDIEKGKKYLKDSVLLQKENLTKLIGFEESRKKILLRESIKKNEETLNKL